MAVNEKAVYATEHITSGDPRNPIRPGQRLDGRVSEDAIRSLHDRGCVTESHAEAQRAEGAEMARQADVARQIENRSEKRDVEKRIDHRG
jgi:hypothetical protein